MLISEKNAPIVEVRRRTSAPISVCKKVLEQSAGDIEAAVRAIAKARHDEMVSAGWHNSYGTVCLYSHEFGRVGVMVEVSCESNYVAKSRDFLKLANTIAVHIAWSNPKGLSRKDVQPGFGEVCLLDQPEIRETQGQKTIQELLTELSNQTGESIEIKRFSRFEIGKTV